MGHVLYGNWVLDHKSLPTEDPFVSLTAGMRLIDSAWLSQVVFAQLERWGGPEALSAAFTLTSLFYFAMLSRTCFLQSRRMTVAGAGLLIALLVGFSRLTTIRPENFGAAMFVLLLWLLVRHRLMSRHRALEDSADFALPQLAAWRLYVGVFIIMVLWANFHGSFICGLALLGCLLAGQLIEAGWRQWMRNEPMAAVLQDGDVRRRLIVFEVGLAATLVNPYGLDLLINSLGFSHNEILNDILEWQPLQLMGIGGREFLLSWVVVTIVLRHSRQRVPVGEALVFGVFALLAAMRLRMIGWYAAIVAVFLAPHLADIWSRFAKPIEREPLVKERVNPLELTPERSWTYSLIALLMIWITFALSPLGRPVVGDETRGPEQIYTQRTPLAAAKYLREHPPETRVFNPQWWGDWLVWDGPPGLEPFVTTNMHLIPPKVWQDYRRIMTVDGWERAMSRYRMESAVLDKERQERLVRAMRKSSSWKVVFEDDQAVILTRSDLGGEEGEVEESEVEEGEGATAPPTDGSDEEKEDVGLDGSKSRRQGNE